MNYATFRDTTIKLLNSFSASGNLTPLTDASVQDAVLRFPSLAEICQFEIATTAKYIHRKKPISQNPIPNLLQNQVCKFNIQSYLGTDLVDMVAKGAKAYNFEIDNIGIAYVEEEVNGLWIINQTINNIVKGQYTIFKGFTGITDVNNNIRIRFSGLYPYNIQNKALYAYIWPTVDDIPQYSRTNSYLMDDNYFELNAIKTNKEIVEWSFEGRKYIGVPYDIVGKIDIFYHAYPTPVPGSNPLDTVISPADTWIFDLDEDACKCMPFYVASQILIDDPVNKSVGARLFDIYQGKLANLSNVITQGSQSVKNSMFLSTDSKLF